MAEMIEMKVAGLTIDSTSNMPVIILRDGSGQRIIPIWIGPFEASAIMLEIEGIKSPRPLTHDLIINLFKTNKMKIEKIVISDIVDTTYFAEIFYKKLYKHIKIDSRPSDAIALALRAKAPIYVTNKVLVASLGVGSVDKKDAETYYKEILEKLDKSAFGKYIQ